MIKNIYHNKTKIIDYLIILKLIFNKYNIYMHNEFYNELIDYIKPIFIFNTTILNENKYFYRYTNTLSINDFEKAYNIKHNFLKIFLKYKYMYINFDDIYQQYLEYLLVFFYFYYLQKKNILLFFP